MPVFASQAVDLDHVAADILEEGQDEYEVELERLAYLLEDHELVIGAGGFEGEVDNFEVGDAALQELGEAVLV